MKKKETAIKEAKEKKMRASK
jgi:hypothetical protein